MTAPALRVVTEDGELLDACPGCTTRDEQIHGLKDTIDMQARKLGNLARKLESEAEKATRPASKEIRALIEKCHRGTGHPARKVSADRIRLVRSRLKDEYSLEHLDLAVEGLIANPYTSYGRPMPTGTPAQRDDELSTALKSGEAVEKYANLGAQARRAAA